MLWAVFAYHTSDPVDAVFQCFTSLLFLAAGWLSSRGRYMDAILDELDEKFAKLNAMIEDHLKLRS